MHGWRVFVLVRIVGTMRELATRFPSCCSRSQGPSCHTTATDERHTVRHGGGTRDNNGADTARAGRVCHPDTPGAVRVHGAVFSLACTRCNDGVVGRVGQSSIGGEQAWGVVW